MATSHLPTQRIAILGVGLIGGSLGLAIRARMDQVEVTGWDEPEILALALERGAISRRAADLEDAVSGADVVMVCAPLAASVRLLGEIAPFVGPGTLVTDTGSVKGPIARQAASVLPEHADFVGGHPMTGSEKSGVEHADDLLFENAVYVLCPEDRDSEGFARLVPLLESIGARVLVLSAETHDIAAARISHLPQLLAISLVNQIAGDDAGARLAAGGFRDMTRIASSSFSMWRSILTANQGPILDELGRFAASLERLRNRLAEGDMEALEAEFRRASDLRASVPERTKGFLNPLSDVFVYTPDEPGALVRITGTLSQAGVDIKDIELLKIREGTGGTFRLGLQDDRAADAAVEALAVAGLHSYRL